MCRVPLFSFLFLLFSLPLFRSLSLSLSITTFGRSPERRQWSRARDRYLPTPAIQHSRSCTREGGRERERDGEKETEGRGEIARRRDRLPIKTKLVAALSPPPPLRGRMRNLAHYFAPSLLIPLLKRPTEERTNESTNRHSRVLSPVVVLRVSLSAFFCFPLFLSLWHTLSKPRTLFSSSRVYACVVRFLAIRRRLVEDLTRRC